MFNTLKNLVVNFGRYSTHPEAAVITCYYNPKNSKYRLSSFKTFYEKMKHLDPYVVECLFPGQESELSTFVTNLKIVNSESLLWHKESLLNLIIRDLPSKIKYVFWIDGDVVFTNNNWLTDSVKVLKDNNIVQPFEYCVHLEKDELTPSIDLEEERYKVSSTNYKNRRMWRGFCANVVDGNLSKGQSEIYDIHGHVGFAWGCRRYILENVGLYDHALIGGADHIMAHAATGEFDHPCILKTFSENLSEIQTWSRKFYSYVQGKVGYAKGDLYHVWHGDISKRQYLKRIKEYTPTIKNIVEKDDNGLYMNNDFVYVNNYFEYREPVECCENVCTDSEACSCNDVPILDCVALNETLTCIENDNFS